MPLQPRQPELPSDGTPVFNVMVRSPVARMWYPLGTLRGDTRARILVTAMRTGWGRRLYGGTLSKGVARIVFSEQGTRMLDGAIRRYPALRKFDSSELEFGYKAVAKQFEYPTQVIGPEMAMSVWQWARMKLTGGKPPRVVSKANVRRE